MKLSVLCPDRDHPVFPRLEAWASIKRARHAVELVDRAEMLGGGDLLFLVSAAEHVKREVREKYRSCLVIHASDLPRGRGWSPWAWQIIEGRKEIIVSLLEAGEKTDSGAIWAQLPMSLQGHELADEINQKLFEIEIALMDFAVEHYADVTPRDQVDGEATYYRKRTPEDSRIDPYRSIAEQFDLLRVADWGRYPAFFDIRGQRYKIKIEKMSKPERDDEST